MRKTWVSCDQFYPRTEPLATDISGSHEAEANASISSHKISAAMINEDRSVPSSCQTLLSHFAAFRSLTGQEGVQNRFRILINASGMPINTPNGQRKFAVMKAHGKPSILFVANESEEVSLLHAELSRCCPEWDLEFIADSRAALARLNHAPCDVLFLDTRLGSGCALALLDAVWQTHPEILRFVCARSPDRALDAS